MILGPDHQSLHWPWPLTPDINDGYHPSYYDIPSRALIYQVWNILIETANASRENGQFWVFYSDLWPKIQDGHRACTFVPTHQLYTITLGVLKLFILIFYFFFKIKIFFFNMAAENPRWPPRMRARILTHLPIICGMSPRFRKALVRRSSCQIPQDIWWNVKFCVVATVTYLICKWGQGQFFCLPPS